MTVPNEVSQRTLEVPITTVPDIPYWSENYCWTAFDPERRISIYIHNGRWYRATSLWHELVLICIDGEQYYVRRNIGRLADLSVLGASCLEMRCLEPFRRWEWSYFGVARHRQGDDPCATRGQRCGTPAISAGMEPRWAGGGLRPWH